MSFTGLRKFWPVARHRRVKIKQTTFDQHVCTDRNHALRRRRDTHNRVAVPWPASGGVGVATPEVHDGVAIRIDTDSRAHFPTLCEICRECLADCRKM
jgi:hypothetical protein